MRTVRFRHSLAHRLAMVVWLLATSALASQRWWFALLLLVPLVFLLHAVREQVYADQDGVTVQALLGRSRVPWEDVAAVRVRGRQVMLQRADGSTLLLPLVRPADVPRLVAASGREIAVPAATAEGQ